VTQYIYDSLTMWQQEYRIDGFRWDSVSCVYNTCGTDGVPLPDGLTLLQNANAQTISQNAETYVAGRRWIPEPVERQFRIEHCAPNSRKRAIRPSI
jgi:pullulanase/glycogen debranching enzyme